MITANWIIGREKGKTLSEMKILVSEGKKWKRWTEEWNKKLQRPGKAKKKNKKKNKKNF